MPATASSQDFFKRACDVASYYGFQPVETALARRVSSGSLPRFRGGDRAAVSSACFSAGSRLAEPLFFYYVNESPRSSFERPNESHAELNLEIVGTAKSVAEAILLKTALSILEEGNPGEMEVAVNGIGDKDCLARFSRELSLYYRRHLNDLHGPCRNNLTKDVFRLVRCTNDACRTLSSDAPRAMNFLTEASRTHFREMLEYLEGLGIPYVVKDSLLGPKDSYSKIVFEIRRHEDDSVSAEAEETHEAEVLATGGRYDDLAKRITSRKDATGAGISILFPRRLYRKRAEKAAGKSSPKAYFVHIGFEAKLKSLLVLDLLRKAHIPVSQGLHYDQLGGQLASAEKLGIPYILIMGQKEAIEGTVIVRDVETRAQETIPIPRLSVYLKSVV